MRRSQTPGGAGRAAKWILGAITALLIITSNMGQTAVLAGKPELATVMPGSIGGGLAAAALVLAQDQPVEASAMARRALALSPVHWPALEALALSSTTPRDDLMRLASRWTRRSAVAQYVLFRSDMEQEHHGQALTEADALLRTGVDQEATIRTLAGLAQSQAGRVALARKLASDPPWRPLIWPALPTQTAQERYAAYSLLKCVVSWGGKLSPQEIARLPHWIAGPKEEGRSFSTAHSPALVGSPVAASRGPVRKDWRGCGWKADQVHQTHEPD